MAKLSNMKREMEDKITKIKVSSDIKTLIQYYGKKVLPPIAPLDEPYYFVSYSHEDYKKVFEDIFRLQAENVPLWYDRDDLILGKKWPEIVKEYASTRNCLGVIFYVSENALKSDQIEIEMKAIDEVEKHILPIELPLPKGYGDDSERDDLQLPAYYQAVKNKAEGAEAEHCNKIAGYINKRFPSDVTFCSYSKRPEDKAKSILDFRKYIESRHEEPVEYQNGWKVGYHDGTMNGLQDGIEAGFAEGYLQGKEDGLKRGSADGYAKGLQEGEKLGIDKGKYQEIIASSAAALLKHVAQGQEFTVTCHVPSDPSAQYLVGEYNGHEVHIIDLFTPREFRGTMDPRYKFNGETLKVRAVEIRIEQTSRIDVEQHRTEGTKQKIVIVARAVS